MSNLKKERLNQMIDNALSYEQELKPFKLNQIYKRLKVFLLKPKVYGLTFATCIISCVIIYPTVTSRNLVDVYEINEYVTFSIIEDL